MVSVQAGHKCAGQPLESGLSAGERTVQESTGTTGPRTEGPTTMITAVVVLVLITAVVAALMRELRAGGYGRERLPSLAEVGAERSRVLRSLAS